MLVLYQKRSRVGVIIRREPHTHGDKKREKKGKITNNLGHNHSRVRNGVVRGKYTAAGASTRIVKQRALSYTHTCTRQIGAKGIDMFSSCGVLRSWRAHRR